MASAAEVNFDQVKTASEDGSSVILDVRNPDEFAAGHIPSAVNVPLGELQEALGLAADKFQEKYKAALPGKEAAVICHCKMGGRAAKGCDVMKEAGFTNVQIYKGSFMDWTEKGGQVVKE
uniref:Endoplasmic reticulum protein n=1 Tax=Acartia pacifica TaxID=335913 RepID=A0A0U2V177_ACAPC|nr:endoplasmic reticulum protein [Acartia pacifica]